MPTSNPQDGDTNTTSGTLHPPTRAVGKIPSSSNLKAQRAATQPYDKTARPSGKLSERRKSDESIHSVSTSGTDLNLGVVGSIHDAPSDPAPGMNIGNGASAGTAATNLTQYGLTDDELRAAGLSHLIAPPSGASVFGFSVPGLATTGDATSAMAASEYADQVVRNLERVLLERGISSSTSLTSTTTVAEVVPPAESIGEEKTKKKTIKLETVFLPYDYQEYDMDPDAVNLDEECDFDLDEDDEDDGGHVDYYGSRPTRRLPILPMIKLVPLDMGSPVTPAAPPATTPTAYDTMLRLVQAKHPGFVPRDELDVMVLAGPCHDIDSEQDIYAYVDMMINMGCGSNPNIDKTSMREKWLLQAKAQLRGPNSINISSLKPEQRGSTADSIIYPIPDSSLCFRIWPDSASMRQWCFDFIDSATHAPVNAPEDYHVYALLNNASSFMVIPEHRIHSMAEKFGIARSEMKEGSSETFMVLENQPIALRREGKQDAGFVFPAHPASPQASAYYF